jgi:isoleucyl-tRNA synthetase
MKFKQGSRRKALEYEKDLVQYWKQNQTFEKSVNNRPKSNAYIFYDGPPFITGVPHHGNLLCTIIKDAVPRYWTMKGKHVERTWGWDCHGLPAEVFTEKKLGIHDRRDIGTKISLEEYITTCRDNMVQTGDLWENTIDRIGRWVDFKGSYKTMDKDYMESVWWAFKQLYEKGKIYEGERVLMYCTRDATPISKAEVAMDNSYQDVTDPSVYVKFKLADRDAYLLAWTTTPWTLPSNSAIAVNKDLEYAEVELEGEHFILAKDLLDKALTDEKHQVLNYKVVQTFKGEQLIGQAYLPLFKEHKELAKQGAFKVYHADFVHAEDGTGIAHESPAYGEEDYLLSKQARFPMILNTDDSGLYTEGEWKGQLVWDANKTIAKTLHERGDVWKIDYITHSYPHCHRCGTKLMYRAHPSWFMDIDGQRTEMLEQNGDVNWFPSHIKDGRFAKTVQSAPDWNLSRDRFWATAMPVWKGTDKDGKEHIKVVGSYAELKELSGVELDDYHRPWVDDITFKIDGVVYQRIDKVLDCWFESGSMPFAQFHYPFENVQKFEENFPGDFVVEYVGQVRAWFYYMHAVSVGLFGKSAFKNVVVTGSVMGTDGKKLSKSLGNYTDPNEVMDQYSSDALRFVLLSAPLLNGEDFTLKDKEVADVNRKLAMIWNMYDFFTLYADVDGWAWDGSLSDPTEDLENPLDQWIVSRVHQLSTVVDEHMQKYDIPNAMKPLLEFVDDASNWYVRRSRKRFWKSDNDGDKQAAYRTLHYVLVQTSMIFAPFTPFLSEELYRSLTGGESVHLLDWPEAGHINELLVRNMRLLRHLITIGLSLRAEAAIKVRQPLASVTLQEGYRSYLTDDMLEILKEELNVKKVKFDDSKFDAEKSFLENLEAGNFSQLHRLELDTALTPALRQEGLMREVVRQVQNARKQADLQVDDRIELSLETADADLAAAITKHADEIVAETLAVKLVKHELKHVTTAKVESAVLTISLQKSA